MSGTRAARSPSSASTTVVARRRAMRPAPTGSPTGSGHERRHPLQVEHALHPELHLRARTATSSAYGRTPSRSRSRRQQSAVRPEEVPVPKSPCVRPCGPAVVSPSGRRWACLSRRILRSSRAVPRALSKASPAPRADTARQAGQPSGRSAGLGHLSGGRGRHCGHPGLIDSTAECRMSPRGVCRARTSASATGQFRERVPADQEKRR